MKYKRFIFSLVLIVTYISILAINAIASAGSKDDPIVTKTYVDSKINELMSKINSLSNNTNNNFLSEAEKQSIIAEIASQFGGNVFEGSTSSSGDNSFKPYLLKKGSALFGSEGTEIILRSGESIVISNVSDGVSDLTNGKDLLKGEKISKNHLLIVPRDDGRGAYAINDCWFMIKGNYKVN